MAGTVQRGTDRARLLWLMPLVTVVIVAIEVLMMGRTNLFGWIDLAISVVLSALAIQIAARAAERIVVVGIVYVLCFTLAWYALTLVALPDAAELKSGNTVLATGGSLRPEGHFHFLSRPFRFAAFTLLLSLMALWGLAGGARKGPG